MNGSDTIMFTGRTEERYDRWLDKLEVMAVDLEEDRITLEKAMYMWERYMVISRYMTMIYTAAYGNRN